MEIYSNNICGVYIKLHVILFICDKGPYIVKSIATCTRNEPQVEMMEGKWD